MTFNINEALQFHEDTFYAYFLPYRHPECNDDIWGGIGIETYGEGFKLLNSLDWNYVWTVIGGSNNPHQWLRLVFAMSIASVIWLRNSRIMTYQRNL